MKKIATIVLSLVVALALSSLNTGFMADTADGPISTVEGEIVGYSYGGLYWDADEYAALGCASEAKSFVIDNETEYLSVSCLSDEDVAVVDEVTHQIGMAIAAGVDEDGNQITYLGGYTFVTEERTTLGGLMRRLEDWAMNKSPYQDMFFSRNWTYKAVKAEDGEQMVNVDVANAVIEFYINEDISELDQWDMLAAMRYAVTCGIAAQQELATVK